MPHPSAAQEKGSIGSWSEFRQFRVEVSYRACVHNSGAVDPAHTLSVDFHIVDRHLPEASFINVLHSDGVSRIVARRIHPTER